MLLVSILLYYASITIVGVVVEVYNAFRPSFLATGDNDNVSTLTLGRQSSFLIALPMYFEWELDYKFRDRIDITTLPVYAQLTHNFPRTEKQLAIEVHDEQISDSLYIQSANIPQYMQLFSEKKKKSTRLLNFVRFDIWKKNLIHIMKDLEESQSRVLSWWWERLWCNVCETRPGCCWFLHNLSRLFG